MATPLGRVCSGVLTRLWSPSVGRVRSTIKPSCILNNTVKKNAQCSNVNNLSTHNYHQSCIPLPQNVRTVSLSALFTQNRLLLNFQSPAVLQFNRSVISWSRNKCKKKTVKAVIHRFYRLDNGIWVRRFAGYKKKAFKKSGARRRRHRQHVLCSKTQSTLLDRMVHPYWLRRRYFIEDPWEKYHDRHFVLGKAWSHHDQRLITNANTVPEHMEKFVPPPRPEWQYRYAKPNKLLAPSGKPPRLTVKDIENYKVGMRLKKMYY
ncbi:large ribosomal subunit protein bL35m-like [Ptychodera flava]|uniref:large ribosomal subunit protein bL35m-like n=1 Tax=Ptychodera flava TaxID=63121 RepID=UPI00396A19FE